MQYDSITLKLADGRTVHGWFVCHRLDDNDIPYDFHRYDLREDDNEEGFAVSIAPSILVNHFGTIITEEDLHINEEMSVVYQDFNPFVSLDVSVGDRVVYKPKFNKGKPVVVVVTSIELCDEPGEKYGANVPTVEAKDIEKCNFCFSDNCWGYGDQFCFKLPTKPIKEENIVDRIKEKLDVLPTCADYKSLLNHVRTLSNMSEDLLRKTYGSFTYRDWARYFNI